MDAITVRPGHLLLKEFAESDVDPLYEIMRDRHHMRFTYSPDSREACAAWLRRYASDRAVRGFAPWTVVHRPDARVVGWGGLNVDPNAPGWGIEVSYFIHPSYAGRGFAAEVVRASLRRGFGELALPRIAAFTRPENRASARVLRKCDFGYVRYEPALARDHYELAREVWQAGLPPCDGGTSLRDAEVEDLDGTRRLFEEYQAEIGVDLCFQGFSEELRTLPGRYARPAGRLLLSVTGAEPSGCGAMRPLGGGACEMKRLYVRPPFRNRGIGRLLAAALIEGARAAGYDCMYLDTLESMEARALYRSLGFVETAPYHDNPEPGAMYMSLPLGRGR